MFRKIELDFNKKYGKLKIIKEVNRKKYGKYSCRIAVCQCDCGNTKEVLIYSLIKGNTKSCGCLLKEWNKKSRKEFCCRVCGEKNSSKFNKKRKDLCRVHLNENNKKYKYNKKKYRWFKYNKTKYRKEKKTIKEMCEIIANKKILMFKNGTNLTAKEVFNCDKSKELNRIFCWYNEVKKYEEDLKMIKDTEDGFKNFIKNKYIMTISLEEIKNV
jgi:hypothetical protein